jgi:hypothetical protein
VSSDIVLFSSPVLYDSNFNQLFSPFLIKIYSSNSPHDIQLNALVVYMSIPKEQVTIFGLFLSNFVLSTETFLCSFDDFGVNKFTGYLSSELGNSIYSLSKFKY